MEDLDPNRKIYIVGDIDHEAYLKFSKRMAKLEFLAATRIHIILCSDGGSGTVALAFYDRIKMSPCLVTICGTGEVASAAVLILAAGKHRMMTPSAWAMVHDDEITSSEFKNRRVSGSERIIEQARRKENQWNELLEKNTNCIVSKWDELHKLETYLTAQDCLELGLIDEILEEK